MADRIVDTEYGRMKESEYKKLIFGTTKPVQDSKSPYYVPGGGVIRASDPTVREHKSAVTGEKTYELVTGRGETAVEKAAIIKRAEEDARAKVKKKKIEEALKKAAVAAKGAIGAGRSGYGAAAELPEESWWGQLTDTEKMLVGGAGIITGLIGLKATKII